MAVVSTFLRVADNKWTKTCAIIGGCAALGFSAYSLYSYLKNKSMIDEGFEDITVIDDNVKKILVLGLDGAGKSSFLNFLSTSEENDTRPDQTEGFSVISVHGKNGKILNFWEIGGSQDIRAYWSNFVVDTDVLLYVVDSADDHKLAESILELHKLTACDKLQKVPILILANKQDLSNASSPESIAKAFGVVELSRYNKIQVMPLQVSVDSTESEKSVSIVKDAVIKLCCGK